MQKNLGIVIGVGIGIAIIIAGITFSINQESERIETEKIIDEKLDEIEDEASENEFIPAPRTWPTSGPFQIDRSEYLIGEKIFIRVGALEEHEKGQMVFLRPLNETHYSVFQTIPFDGMKKTTFNYYTEPRLAAANEICTVDDILGTWTLVFQGTDYKDIKFEIVNKTLPGEEDAFVSVC